MFQLYALHRVLECAGEFTLDGFVSPAQLGHIKSTVRTPGTRH